ncbi:hypothetical protein GCM10027162_52920 [Streptomyces incanus]
MSTRSSPYASGPPPPRENEGPQGRNPLIRTSDRVEFWLRRVLVIVRVVGLPVAGLVAGRTAYASSLPTVRARAVLDEAGPPDVRITVSGGLDGYAVDDLVRSGAPIGVYAVGTRVGVSADAPYPDSAYEMVEYEGRPVMKLSSAKVTAPGRQQVFRRPGCADVTGLADERPPRDGTPLLETAMRHGQRTGERSALDECRERFAADLAALPPAARRIRAPYRPGRRPPRG